MPVPDRDPDRAEQVRLPVARVAVDVSLPHLDRPFDYLVPPDLDAAAQPGVRVRVRFSGRLVDGFVLARDDLAEPERRLAELTAVVSAEPVLHPAVADLARAVADRYAGTLPDVLRLAVPRRHAAVEAEVPEPVPAAPLPSSAAGTGAGTGWNRYHDGDRWLAGLRGLPPGGSGVTSEPVPGLLPADPALVAGLLPADPALVAGLLPADPALVAGLLPADPALVAGSLPADASAVPAGHEPAGRGVGEQLRVVWTALPGEDWPARIAEAVAATLAAGRGALVVVPDRRDLARTDGALAAALGPGRHVALSAELGPQERYRRFLRLSRGQVRAVVGTRAAMFAPVADLGLVVVWDDGDDLHAEPRAPYPHVREVLTLRAHRTGAAALLGGHAVTAEAALLLRSGWARPVAADRRVVRAAAPAVAAVSDADLSRDPLARAARLPHAVFEAARRSLVAGLPVLVSVPRSGYVPGLCCALCRRPARCRACGGPLEALDGAGARACGWCGRPATDWACPADGHRRLRAVVVGVDRTAEELGRAFPGVRVRTSGRSGRVLAEVPDRPALVVATPGAEPVVTVRDPHRTTTPDGSGPVGYGAVLLLDGWLPLSRPDLRAGEEAVRRWLAAAALAVSARSGGQVVLVADAGLPAVQAMVRWDPAGFAGRELDERVALHFPPAARTVALTGPADAVAELVGLVELPPDAEVLGPVPVPPPTPRRPARAAAPISTPTSTPISTPISTPTGIPTWRRPVAAAQPRPAAPGAPDHDRPGRDASVAETAPVRALLRAPLGHGGALVAAVKAATGVRSARKSPGAIRVQVDPREVG